jgi:hypothetical protein
LYILIFRSFIWDAKKEDFGLNNSKHSPNLIYSLFHHECHSDLCHPKVFELCHLFKWYYEILFL